MAAKKDTSAATTIRLGWSVYINHVFQFVARILEIGALLQNPQGMVDTLGDADLPGEKVGRYILAPHLGQAAGMLSCRSFVLPAPRGRGGGAGIKPRRCRSDRWNYELYV